MNSSNYKLEEDESSQIISKINPIKNQRQYIFSSVLQAESENEKIICCIQIQPFSLIHRLAIFQLCQYFAIHHFMSRFLRQSFDEDHLQIFVEFFQQTGVNILNSVKRCINHFDLKYRQLGLHQINKCFQQHSYTFPELLDQINFCYPIIQFRQIRQIPKPIFKNSHSTTKIIGNYNKIYLQKICQEYFLAYSVQFSNSNQEFEIRLEIDRSGQKNIRQIKQLIKMTNGEFAVQCGQKIQVFLNFYCIGITALIENMNKIIEKKVIKFYRNLKITQKQKASKTQIKSFSIKADKQFKSIAKFFCQNYHKNSQNYQQDWSQQFTQNKKQSKLFFANFSQLNQRHIELLTKQYSQSNILFLKTYWETGLREFILNIYRNWENYKQIYWNSMKKFIELLDYKSFEIRQKYESFYPGSTGIMNVFMKKLKINSIEQQINRRIIKSEKKNETQIKQQYLRQVQFRLKVAEHLVDSIIKYLTVVQEPGRKDQKFKISIPGQLLKNKTINFSNLIAALQQFQAETSKWQDAINIVFKDIRKVNHMNGDYNENIFGVQFRKVKQFKVQHLYFQNIQNENLTRVSCLGCSRNFVHNANIADNSINTSKIITFEKIDVLQNEKKWKQIKLAICALLNDVKGGVILFNCCRKYQNIMTFGSVITQTMKISLKENFIHIIECFKPLINLTNVALSFVPVIANPLNVKPFRAKQVNYGGELGMIKNKKYIRRKYYEGTYVVRIVVKPLDKIQVFYFEDDQQSMFSYLQGQNVMAQKISQIQKYIKKKMIYYISDEYSSISKNLLMIPSPFDHKCDIPQQGIKVSVRYDLVQSNNKQKAFRFVSYLQVDKKKIQIVQTNLTDLNIRSLIQVKFTSYQFCPDNAAILYHDMEAKSLKQLINTHYNFLTIKDSIQLQQITQYLKFFNYDKYHKIQNFKFQSFSKSFRQEFPYSLIKFYQLLNDELCEYFVKSQSKVQNLYLYLMLNYNKEKVQFAVLPNITNYSEKGILKEIQIKKQSMRVEINQIYRYLDENLREYPKKVYQIFYKAVDDQPLGRLNIIDNPQLFYQLYTQLVENENLILWKQKMLNYLSYQPTKLMRIVEQFHKSKDCVAFLGIKIVKLSIILFLEHQKILTKQLEEQINNFNQSQTIFFDSIQTLITQDLKKSKRYLIQNIQMLYDLVIQTIASLKFKFQQIKSKQFIRQISQINDEKALLGSINSKIISKEGLKKCQNYDDYQEHFFDSIKQVYEKMGNFDPRWHHILFVKTLIKEHISKSYPEIILWLKKIIIRQKQQLDFRNKMQLISLIIILYNQIQYVDKEYHQKIKGKMQIKLVQQIAQQKEGIILQTGLSPQQKMHYIAVKSIYLSLTTGKQINIICMCKTFQGLSKKRMSHLLQLLQLDKKIIYFNYKDKIKRAMTNLKNEYLMDFNQIVKHSTSNQNQNSIQRDNKRQIDFGQSKKQRILIIEAYDLIKDYNQTQ